MTVPAGTPTRYDVLVVVGTDHHRFDRVVRWLDDWLAQQSDPVPALVQHGSAAPPRRAAGAAMLQHDEMLRRMHDARVVVSHGGPATIFDARAQGRRPIVVPRDPRRGEHVDDHQQLFARRLAAAGLVILCEDEASFRAALSAGVADPGTCSVPPDEIEREQARVADVVLRVGLTIDEVVRVTHRR